MPRVSRKSSSVDAIDEIDLSRLTRVAGRGIFAAEVRGVRALKATYVVVDDRSVALSLADGRKLAAPLNWYPRLEHATPAERNDWRLIMDGRAVSWRSLGLAVSVKALIAGERADEPAASLKKWLNVRRVTGPKRKAG